MFSACPVGLEVQRSIRQIAPNNAFRLGLKSPGERFGRGAGGASEIRTHDTIFRSSIRPPVDIATTFFLIQQTAAANAVPDS
jgi:hypothetical protein